MTVYLCDHPCTNDRHKYVSSDLCHEKLQGGQRFAGDSDSPISIVPHLKLTSVLILKEPYSIEKCATCLDTFLRF